METHDELKEALHRLIQCANEDTGGSRRVAEFLLSLWNGTRFKADLQEILYSDKPQFDDMQTVIRGLYAAKDQLDTYVTEEQMKPIIEEWGEVFAR
jgi:hypothetical protein